MHRRKTLAKIKKSRSATSIPINDMDPLHKPILVVGAARSGTYLLASTIAENFDVTYIGEANELWKRHVPASKHDFVPASVATEDVTSKTRRAFAKRCRARNRSTGQRGARMLEKTPANTLRMPFMKKVFPDAVFVHIIRDGRDVAVSARRKYSSDFRKTTKVKEPELTFADRVEQLIRTISGKIEKGLRLKALLADPLRYWEGALRTLGAKRDAMWGPRFPGFEVYREHCSKLELGAIQWKVCVDAARSFVASNRHASVCEVRYENLLARPGNVLGRVFDFIADTGLPAPATIRHDITQKGRTWRDEVTREEIKEMARHIEGTLLALDYSPSWETSRAPSETVT